MEDTAFTCATVGLLVFADAAATDALDANGGIVARFRFDDDRSESTDAASESESTTLDFFFFFRRLRFESLDSLSESLANAVFFRFFGGDSLLPFFRLQHCEESLFMASTNASGSIDFC